MFVYISKYLCQFWVLILLDMYLVIHWRIFVFNVNRFFLTSINTGNAYKRDFAFYLNLQLEKSLIIYIPPS